MATYLVRLGDLAIMVSDDSGEQVALIKCQVLWQCLHSSAVDFPQSSLS